MDRSRIVGLVVLGMITLLLIGYFVEYLSPPMTENERTPKTQISDPEVNLRAEADAFVAGYRGRILVLLLGMQTCPGTALATDALVKYVEQPQKEIAVVRMDVPPPIGEFLQLEEGELPFEYRTDPERLVAAGLDFFYYPTLYIFDQEGQMRYSGGCDDVAILDDMLRTIIEEEPGDPKHVFTPPLMEVGARAPEFTSVTLDGELVSLGDLSGEKATAVIFARTSCRFTVAGFSSMHQLRESFKDKGVEVFIINKGEPADRIRSAYMGLAPGAGLTCINPLFL